MSSDPYPPTRVDVSVLFGEELSGRGHTIDWLLQSEAPCARSYVTSWGGGRVWVGAADRRPGLLSALHKHFAGIWNDAKVFGLLRGNNYDAVEVKDKGRQVAAKMIEASKADLEFHPGRGAWQVRGDPATALTWADLAAHAGEGRRARPGRPRRARRGLTSGARDRERGAGISTRAASQKGRPSYSNRM